MCHLHKQGDVEVGTDGCRLKRLGHGEGEVSWSDKFDCFAPEVRMLRLVTPQPERELEYKAPIGIAIQFSVCLLPSPYDVLAAER